MAEYQAERAGPALLPTAHISSVAGKKRTADRMERSEETHSVAITHSYLADVPPLPEHCTRKVVIKREPQYEPPAKKMRLRYPHSQIRQLRAAGTSAFPTLLRKRYTNY